MRGWVGERADDPEHLDNRARPAVRDDQRQRVLVSRLDVDEVDAEAVDLGLELRQPVQFRLAFAPVIIGRPLARQLLQHRQLHALRPIVDQLLMRPARRRDARTQRLSASGISTMNGRIAAAPADSSVMTDMWAPRWLAQARACPADRASPTRIPAARIADFRS